MMFLVVDVIGTILDVLIVVSLIGIIAPPKDIDVKRKLLVVLFAMVIRCVTAVSTESTLLITLVAFISYMFVQSIYRINIVKRVLVSVSIIVLFILAEIVMGVILAALSNQPVEQLAESLFFYIEGALMSKVIVFIIVKAIGYFSTASETKVSSSFYVALLVHPVATFLVVFVMSEYMYVANAGRFMGLSAIAVIILIVSNVLLFYMFERYQRVVEEKTRQKMIERDLEYKAQYYKELSDRQRITNKTMHDLKNQMFALKESLQLDVNEGIEKINSLCDDILLSKAVKYTGNEAVDALIVVKNQRMNDMDIAFMPSVYMSNINKIDTFDMCILLGNLLDNAIEASERVDKKKRNIQLVIKQREMYLSIQTCNVVEEQVAICDNKIVSSKSQKELHGFGLNSVAEIVKKYNGNMVLKQEGEWFKAILMLENC